MARFRLLELLLGLALAMPSVRAQEVQLQPAAAFVGDIVRLSIEYRSEIPSLYPLDTEPLERDFEVLKVESRTSRAIAGAGYVNRMHWEIELVPRKVGELRLPGLSVGNWRTPLLTLPVSPLPEALRVAQQVSVDIETDSPAPYVGQQIDLKLRVRHNTPVTRAYWTEPRIVDALSFRGIDEIEYRDADGFDINERVMAIFVDTPGHLTIPAASFRGRVGAWRGGVGADVPPRRIFRQSRPLALELRAVPADFGDGPWLPARAFEWAQRWELPTGGYRVGDSLQRILTLEARGLPAGALPADLFVAETDAYRVYADRAQRRHGFVGRDLVAHLEQSFAIVLTRAGSVDIPPLRLAWWDVGADRRRELSLPGRTLVVAAAPRADSVAGSASRRAAALWSWLPALGLLALAGLAVQVVRRGWPTRVARFWRLRAACRANDPAGARRALLDWAACRWPEADPVGLWQFRQRVAAPALLAELARLDAALYASPPAHWQGVGLWQALRAELRAQARRRSPVATPLAPLYPSTPRGAAETR